ncbi:hypothetical protein B0T13DRAFT_445471 [Neurospora crassa]|nr:hypothetical protein B0T13DRAFT_445471 [Neurospora crassa]
MEEEKWREWKKEEVKRREDWKEGGESGEEKTKRQDRKTASVNASTVPPSHSLPRSRRKREGENGDNGGQWLGRHPQRAATTERRDNGTKKVGSSSKVSRAAAGGEVESAQVGMETRRRLSRTTPGFPIRSCSRSRHRRPHSTQVEVEEKEGVGDKRRLMIKLAASTALASVSVPVRGFCTRAGHFHALLADSDCVVRGLEGFLGGGDGREWMGRTPPKYLQEHVFGTVSGKQPVRTRSSIDCRSPLFPPTGPDRAQGHGAQMSSGQAELWTRRGKHVHGTTDGSEEEGEARAVR